MAAGFDFLVDALNKIQRKEHASLSFNEIYFLVFKIVKRRETLQLYNLVVDVIRNHLSSTIRPKITDDLKKSEIESIVKAWNDHEACLQCFTKLLYFLDRDVARRLPSENIQILGVNIFKTEVLEPNRGILQSVLLETVQAERNGQTVSIAPVKRMIDMILTVTDMNYYENYFEELFLKDSESYYKMRFQVHIESGDTIGYIISCRKYVLDEKSRIKRYLHENTEPKILNLLSEIFLPYLDNLVKLDAQSNIQTDFSHVFNYRKMPEYLASYMHNMLRNEKDQDALESYINTFIDLYKNLVDKDIFESFYKTNLAKRLLCVNPTPLEVENRVISRLKAECASFTKTLEEMINDIEISEIHRIMFTDELKKKKEIFPFEFSLKILKQGLWKVPLCSPCNLPATFSSVFEVYHEFYNRHHNGRKLRLLNNLGDALITGCFARPEQPKKSRKYSFTVSTTQMLILLLFNDQESLRFKEIQELTAIDAERLKCSLIPITLRKPRHKILDKVSGDHKSIQIDDIFRINSNYSSTTRRVKLPFQVSTVEKVDSEGIWAKTEAERIFEIDAAIVRAMKAHRVLTHVALVQQVISLLKNRFHPNVMTIDSRILQLIDKECIQKKPNENSYVYLP